MEATQACAAFDPRARLVSIHPDNKDHVKTLLAETGGQVTVWMGLFRRHDGSGWLWTDGTPVDFTNWRDGEPNNADGGEHCGSLYMPDEGEWNDDTCSDKLFFLCQITLK